MLSAASPSARSKQHSAESSNPPSSTPLSLLRPLGSVATPPPAAASGRARHPHHASYGSHSSHGSHEIHLHHDVTRDSMVENMLMSFNDITPTDTSPGERVEDDITAFRNNVLFPAARAMHNPRDVRSPSLDSEDGDDDYTAEYMAAARHQRQRSASGPSARPAATGSKQRSQGSVSTMSSVDPGVRSRHSASTSQRTARNSRQNSVELSSPVASNISPRANMAASASSVLNRSRPVPAEYHDFQGLGQKRSTIRSISSSPMSPPLATHVSPNASQKPRTSHGPGSGPGGSESTRRDYFDAQSFPVDHHGPRHSASMGALDSSRGSVYNVPPLPANAQQVARQQMQPVSTAAANASAPPKEKAGFFRRVFGTRNTSVATDARPAPGQLPALTTAANLNSSQPNSPGLPTPTAAFPLVPPPIPGESDGKPVPAPPLRNKTSFFRRRRKTGGNDKEAPTTLSRQPTAHGTGDSWSGDLAAARAREHDGDEGRFQATADSDAGSAGFGHAYSPVTPSGGRTASRPVTSEQRFDQSSPLSPPSPPQSDIRASLVGTWDSASGRYSTRLVRNAPQPDMASLHHVLLGLPANGSPADGLDHSRAPSALSDTSHNSLRSGRGSVLVRSDTKTSVGPSTGRFSALSNAPTDAMVDSNRSPEDPLPESPGAASLYVSASSLPLVQVEGDDGAPVANVVSDMNDPLEPTPADHEKAQRLLNPPEPHVNHTKAMAVLHQADAEGERVRRAFLSLYDFAGLSILQALRSLCSRVTLKGETQQVDRVLSTFAYRWCICNPNHGFKSQDVVHTICYSILLLNTDLHMANVDSKMSRSQFIKNTLPTLRSVIDGADEDTIKAPPSSARPGLPWRDMRSPTPVEGSHSSRPSVEQARPSGNRLSVLSPSFGRPVSDLPGFSSPSPFGNRPGESTALVSSPHEGTSKGWDSAIEGVLKDIYASIRDERLPLYGPVDQRLQNQDSSDALSVGGNLRRNASIISKSPSEPRGRSEAHSAGPSSRFASRTRTRNRLYPASTFTSSRTGSRTSLEEGLWSQSASSTWSKSIYQTQTTMSTDSIGSRMTMADERYQQSIGFANALSHAIIREEGQMEDEDESPPQAFEIDELLELAGAPFAKEGIVKHKHHLETTDRKARDRNWSEVFVVIEKGWMRLFSFNTKSVRAAQKKIGSRTVVGGGNWTENAETIAEFMLRQTIANALPPPGYSKQRPHVFALSLPNGAVHLFHVGTAEIAKEFVSTANYWSARLSKEPLVGGVSNVEYGWGDSVVNMALLPDNASISMGSTMRSPTPTSGAARANMTSPTGGSSHSRTASASMGHSSRPSISGSIRGSVEAAATRAKLPADRLQLADWSPPQQSLMASSLPEAQQLEALQNYVKDVEQELTHHNELRSPMLLAFTPRHPNATKAMANWEKKSSYLLREIVKFRTYIDSLLHAQKERDRLNREREEYEAERRRNMQDHKKNASQSTNGSFEFPEETKEAIRLAQQRDRLIM